MWLLGGLPVGKLFGIRIQLDWSVLFIILLVTVSLASGLLPFWHPEWSPLLTWATALGAALLLFISILLHELSHALVAKAYGIPVSRITLFLFGGMANIEHDPDSPKKEVLMAIVGPITSIALGVLCLVLASVSVGSATEAADPVELIAGLSPLATLLAWLGPINILLGMFNMVPGFPLDGGRVLRAVLWKATGNLRVATRWASRSGQVFAWLLIAAGIAMAFGAHIPIFGSGFVSGLWLAFIGWFLNSAAIMSYQQMVAKETLEDVPLRRLLSRTAPLPIPAETTIDAFIDDHAMTSEWRVFPTEAEDGHLGIVNIADVQRVPKADRQRTAVSEISRSLDEAPQISIENSAYDAMRAFAEQKTEWLVVMNGPAYVSLLRREDVARWPELLIEDDQSGTRQREIGSDQPAQSSSP